MNAWPLGSDLIKGRDNASAIDTLTVLPNGCLILGKVNDTTAILAVARILLACHELALPPENSRFRWPNLGERP